MNSRSSRQPRVVVYPQEFHRGGRALQAILKGGFDVVVADSLEHAASQPADAHVLLMPGWPLPPDRKTLSAALLDRLKNRKVVGIGYGAGNLFDSLGLEISSGATMGAGRRGFQRIRLQPNDLLPGGEGAMAATKPNRPDRIPMDFALHIPERSHLRREVDVLARWIEMPDYAPVMRQGHHLLIGYFDPRRWTPAFARYFQRLLDALIHRPRSGFQVARWDTTPPGRREFTLAPYGASVGDVSRRFHFRFPSPTRFIARLRSRGSRKVRLLLHSIPSLTASGGFAEGPSGKPIRVLCEITRAEIVAVSPGTWRLDVTNWDEGRSARCTLSLRY